MSISLNGTTYSGSPAATSNPFPPDADGIERTEAPVGKTLVADSGKRNFITRSVRKPQWKLKWTNANLTTRNAVKTVAELNATFAFVDQVGVSWTVQCEEDDTYTETTSFTIHGGTSLYNLSLSFHLAT